MTVRMHPPTPVRDLLHALQIRLLFCRPQQAHFFACCKFWVGLFDVFMHGTVHFQLDSIHTFHSQLVSEGFGAFGLVEYFVVYHRS